MIIITVVIIFYLLLTIFHLKDYSYWTRSVPMQHLTVHIALDEQVALLQFHHDFYHHFHHHNEKHFDKYIINIV